MDGPRAEHEDLWMPSTTRTRILVLLRDKDTALSAGEIARALDVTLSDVIETLFCAGGLLDTREVIRYHPPSGYALYRLTI